MMNGAGKRIRAFVFDYRALGADWVLTIRAGSLEEAFARVDGIRTGDVRYAGEVLCEGPVPVPVGAGSALGRLLRRLTRPFVWRRAILLSRTGAPE